MSLVAPLPGCCRLPTSSAIHEARLSSAEGPEGCHMEGVTEAASVCRCIGTARMARWQLFVPGWNTVYSVSGGARRPVTPLFAAHARRHCGCELGVVSSMAEYSTGGSPGWLVEATGGLAFSRCGVAPATARICGWLAPVCPAVCVDRRQRGVGLLRTSLCR